MAQVLDYPSATQVRNAGKLLRAWYKGSMTDEERLFHAFETVALYRASHSKPMTHANMGLRSVVKSQGCKGRISQRLKQMRTIVEKLDRYPRMALPTMQDIGGCRAILENIDQVRRVEKKLVKNAIMRNDFYEVDDYIKDPRESGYRGVHVIVGYGDPIRKIEVQLRTPSQHEWAFAVERLGGRTGFDLKSGYGPEEVLKLMEVVSEAMDLESRGEPVDSSLVSRIESLRRDALPYLVARPTGGRP